MNVVAKEMVKFNSENICVRIEQTLKSQLYDRLASRLVDVFGQFANDLVVTLI